MISGNVNLTQQAAQQAQQAHDQGLADLSSFIGALGGGTFGGGVPWRLGKSSAPQYVDPTITGGLSGLDGGITGGSDQGLNTDFSLNPGAFNYSFLGGGL